MQLFTGQKKQPVIVPMYAASLVSLPRSIRATTENVPLQTPNPVSFLQGMLEPTKEPVKPVSAAEMIASIAQAPPLAPEKSSCPSDVVQVGLREPVILLFT